MPVFTEAALSPDKLVTAEPEPALRLTDFPLKVAGAVQLTPKHACLPLKLVLLPVLLPPTETPQPLPRSG